MAWQPIETAPKDLMCVLGWCPGWMALACFHDDEWHEGPGGNIWHPTHWQPLPAPPEPANDDAAFLTTLLQRVEKGERVTLEDVSRLRRLADWADAPPCTGWDGTLDVNETKRAVEDAMGRMKA
jgi:hypothetical protein